MKSPTDEEIKGADVEDQYNDGTKIKSREKKL